MLNSDTFNIKINILIVRIINNELNALFWKKKERDEILYLGFWISF